MSGLKDVYITDSTPLSPYSSQIVHIAVHSTVGIKTIFIYHNTKKSNIRIKGYEWGNDYKKTK